MARSAWMITPFSLSASVISTWRKMAYERKATWHNLTIRRRRQTSSIGRARNPGSMDGSRENPVTLPDFYASRGTDDSLATNPPPSGVGHPPGRPGGPVSSKPRASYPAPTASTRCRGSTPPGIRAINLSCRQVLIFSAPRMREFISRQEFMFVGTADRHGECDCSPRFGEPGFIHVQGPSSKWQRL